jgi:transposase-like protein
MVMLDARIKVRYCPRGHDKHEVGVSVNYQCAKCRKEMSLERNRSIRGWSGTDSSTAVYLKNLKAIRNELGLSVAEMARYCGISKGTYFGLQSNRRRAGKDMQRKVWMGVKKAIADHRRNAAQARPGGYYRNIGGATGAATGEEK